MKTKKIEKSRIVKGVIIPSGWNSSGDFTKVSLSAIDDEEYLIENGEKFIELINQCISATGVVQKDKRSTKTIRIKKFSVVDPLTDV
jgi:hypothetical protein